MFIYSRSAIQNVDNWRFPIRKNKCITQFLQEHDIDNLTDKIYLYTINLNEPKHPFLIKKGEDIGIKHLNDLKAFIEYSPYMDDVYNNGYNANRKIINLIVFDDVIANIMTHKKFQTTVKELFIR